MFLSSNQSNSEKAMAQTMGSTGDPPVPGGDSPLGTGERGELFLMCAFLELPAVVPSGQWPVPPHSNFGVRGSNQ